MPKWPPRVEIGPVNVPFLIVRVIRQSQVKPGLAYARSVQSVNNRVVVAGEVGKAMLGVGFPEPIGCDLRIIPESLFTLPQGLRSTRALGDVMNDTAQPDHISGDV